MNYIKIMNQIIDKAIYERGQPRTYHSGRKKYSRSGFHLHHIIPASMGGTDDGSNIAIVTPREHFLIHWMLHRIYGGTMTVAFRMMIDGKYTSHRKFGARLYERLTLEAMNALREIRDTPEFKLMAKDRAKRTAKSPDWIASNKVVLDKIHNDPAIRKAHADSIEKRGKNPEWQAMHADQLKRMHSSEEYKENHRKAMAKLRTCPKFKKSAQERAAKLKSNDKWIESCRKAWLAKCKPTIGFNIEDGSVLCLVGDKDAAAHGFCGSKICCVVKGKRPTHKGHTWRYATYEEVEQYRPGHEWLELNKPT